LDNFTFYNPVRIVFGRGTIAQLNRLIDRNERVMMLYGGGSIKKNGVYDQVVEALKHHDLIEFPGIEPNPEYETCLQAVAKARNEHIDFLLAVGGGSVLDATKFIAAAIRYEGKDPWDILSKSAPIKSALPLASVLTLPATGSEMNRFAVISRRATGEKLAFGSEKVYPRFSILDPETTYSLPERQVANGIVDSFVHVMEQYMTYPVNAPLQDRMAESILITLIEEGLKVKDDPSNYDVRANLMWCSTMALNGIIACGVPQDWATHVIGHEITAMHGLDHAATLAIILPALLRHQKDKKAEKLIQYGQRVWGLTNLNNDDTITRAIEKTENFFQSVGIATRLGDYNLTPEDCMPAAERIAARDGKIGEHGDIGKKEIQEILGLAA